MTSCSACATRSSCSTSGRVIRELTGEAMTERNMWRLRSAYSNRPSTGLPPDERRSCRCGSIGQDGRIAAGRADLASGCGATRAPCWRLLVHHRSSWRLSRAASARPHRRSSSRRLANEGLALALVAMAQTLPVLTGGLDLSIGRSWRSPTASPRTSSAASPLRSRSASLLVLATGGACGLLNGVIVVYGRIQPIIATLATSAVYTGIAYLLRPVPGGEHRCRSRRRCMTGDGRSTSSRFRCCCSPACCRPSGGSFKRSPAGSRRLRRRLVGGGGLHVRPRRRPAKLAAYALGGLPPAWAACSSDSRR